MSRIDLIKNSIGTLRENLKRYTTLIPEIQKKRFENDLKLIFSGLDTTEEKDSLLKMEKLAKTKLTSVQRIYGEIREEKKNEFNPYSFLDVNSEKNLIEKYGIDPSKPIESKYENIKEKYFNKDLINEYQTKYKEEQKKIIETYLQVMSEIEEKQSKKKENESIDSMLKYGKDIDPTNVEILKDKKIIKKLKENYIETLKSQGIQDAEEQAEKVDFDKQYEEYKRGNNSNQTENFEKYADVSKSDEIFSSLNNKRISDSDLEQFNSKVKPILENPNISEDDKKKLFLSELKKAEDSWTEKNLDGEITYNLYGEFKFKFFKDEEKIPEEKHEEIENNKKNENIQDNSNGKKTYVWRDGKLVEGKAKERKSVTYSNWHSGHLNPDDVRKHRELLDRQHYGGPLWDGIKYVGNLSAGQKEVIVRPLTPNELENNQNNLNNLNNKITLPQNDAKNEIIEIVR
jgi:hypothetical protein